MGDKEDASEEPAAEDKTENAGNPHEN